MRIEENVLFKDALNTFYSYECAITITFGILSFVLHGHYACVFFQFARDLNMEFIITIIVLVFVRNSYFFLFISI